MNRKKNKGNSHSQLDQFVIGFTLLGGPIVHSPSTASWMALLTIHPFSMQHTPVVCSCTTYQLVAAIHSFAATPVVVAAPGDLLVKLVLLFDEKKEKIGNSHFNSFTLRKLFLLRGRGKCSTPGRSTLGILCRNLAAFLIKIGLFLIYFQMTITLDL